jgi:hypothetical protein
MVIHFNIDLLYAILFKIHLLAKDIIFMEHEKLKKKNTKEKSIKNEISKSAHIDEMCAAAPTADDEQYARIKLRELKKFYTDLLIYGVVCICSIIVWLSMGAGTFWPIWVIIGCGINIGLRAITLGQVPMLEEFFPFLGNTWEEAQLEKVLNRPVSYSDNQEQHTNYGVNHKSD